jgi:pyrroloquinoline-quinone synthase
MTTATPVRTERVLAELDTLIAQRSILQHPFYRAWTAGALTREDLAVYARVYYPHVAAFPGYLRTAIAGAQAAPATPAAVADTLNDNLRDELSVPAPHNELWLRFAEAVGADGRTVHTAAPAAGVAKVTSTFRQLCDGSPARALTALYAYESQQPAVTQEKITGLREQYGLTNEQALAYARGSGRHASRRRAAGPGRLSRRRRDAGGGDGRGDAGARRLLAPARCRLRRTPCPGGPVVAALALPEQAATRNAARAADRSPLRVATGRSPRSRRSPASAARRRRW